MPYLPEPKLKLILGVIQKGSHLYLNFSQLFCVCSWPSPLYDPQWNCHVHVTTTCSRGSAYHRHDLFSHGCICFTDKCWEWWEPDAKFRMTSLCCFRGSQKEPLTVLFSLFFLSVWFLSVYHALHTFSHIPSLINIQTLSHRKSWINL